MALLNRVCPSGVDRTFPAYKLSATTVCLLPKASAPPATAEWIINFLRSIIFDLLFEFTKSMGTDRTPACTSVRRKLRRYQFIYNRCNNSGQNCGAHQSTNQNNSKRRNKGVH